MREIFPAGISPSGKIFKKMHSVRENTRQEIIKRKLKQNFKKKYN